MVAAQRRPCAIVARPARPCGGSTCHESRPMRRLIPEPSGSVLRSTRHTAPRSGARRIDPGSACAWSPRSTARPSSTAPPAARGTRTIRPVLKQLRSIADVIIVGAGHRAGRRLRTAEQARSAHRGRHRIGARRRPHAAVHSGAGFLITTTPPRSHASVDTVRAGDDAVDLLTALLALAHGVRRPAVRAVRGRAEPQRVAVRRATSSTRSTSPPHRSSSAGTAPGWRPGPRPRPPRSSCSNC